MMTLPAVILHNHSSSLISKNGGSILLQISCHQGSRISIQISYCCYTCLLLTKSSGAMVTKIHWRFSFFPVSFTNYFYPHMYILSICI